MPSDCGCEARCSATVGQYAERIRQQDEMLRRLEATLEERTAERDALREACHVPSAPTPSVGLPAMAVGGGFSADEVQATPRAHHSQRLVPGGRRMLQTEGTAKYCSKSEVRTVIDASLNNVEGVVEKRKQAVLDILSTNERCGLCLLGAARNAKVPDVLFTLHSCMHMEEDSCADSSDLPLPLMDGATLQDRNSLVALLETASADCAYCIVATIDFVCGTGCAVAKLHIFLDYDPVPRPCVPGLARRLASAQAEAVRTIVSAAMPFGLTAPAATSATALFVASADRFNGMPVYRGVGVDQWLYRCESVGTDETWAVSSVNDAGERSRCEGRLWIDLETATLYFDRSDRSQAAGGLHFDLDVAECANNLAADTFSLVREATGAEATGSALSYSFLPGASATDVSCALMRWVGPYAAGSAGRAVTVDLPGWISAISLVVDIVVHTGDSLCIRSAANTSVVVVIGRRQVTVQSGGFLELQRLSLVNSVGGAALVSRGEARAANCTFQRCVTYGNLLVRATEGSTQTETESSSSSSVIRATLGSWGGAVFSYMSTAFFVATGCHFVENAVRGSNQITFGGAIASFGGRVALEGTSIRLNRAEGTLLLIVTAPSLSLQVTSWRSTLA